MGNTKRNSIQCPKCNSKSYVLDTVTNPDDNETYRKRECTECGNVFFTLEMIVDADSCLLENWYRYSRDTIRREKNKELYGKTKKPKL